MKLEHSTNGLSLDRSKMNRLWSLGFRALLYSLGLYAAIQEAAGLFRSESLLRFSGWLYCSRLALPLGSLWTFQAMATAASLTNIALGTWAHIKPPHRKHSKTSYKNYESHQDSDHVKPQTDPQHSTIIYIIMYRPNIHIPIPNTTTSQPSTAKTATRAAKRIERPLSPSIQFMAATITYWPTVTVQDSLPGLRSRRRQVCRIHPSGTC